MPNVDSRFKRLGRTLPKDETSIIRIGVQSRNPSKFSLGLDELGGIELIMVLLLGKQIDKVALWGLTG